MNCMNWKVGTLALGLLFGVTSGVAQPPQSQLPGYSPPPELRRTVMLGRRLNRTDTTYTSYALSSSGKKVHFRVFSRLQPSDSWNTAAKQVETVSYYITAIAPLYAGNWDSLYVIGVLNNSATVIEKWQVNVTKDPSGRVSDIIVEKDNVLTSLELTTIRAAAASPNERFLIVQRHETQEILKLSLTTGKANVLLTRGAYPNLEHYDLIEWNEHTIEGDVFFVVEGGRSDTIKHPGVICLWDNDLDGIPDNVEELTPRQFSSRGYNNGNVWEPGRTLNVFH